LSSLYQQTIRHDSYEIIVVDNQSSKTTKKLVEKYIENQPNIRYFIEKKLGLSYARNRGVEEASHDYIAFIDDDAYASDNWLECALNILINIKPKPAVIGGKILPYYLSSKPSWFRDNYEIRSWGEKPRYLEKFETFSGSNMIIQRGILEKLGGFDVNLGMSGNILMTGEETALFKRIWLENDTSHTFYYSPDLIVYHLVPEFKMAVRYRLKREFMVGQSTYEEPSLKKVKKPFPLIIKVLGDIKNLFKIPFPRDGERQVIQRRIVEGFQPLMIHLGQATALLGIRFEMKQRNH